MTAWKSGDVGVVLLKRGDPKPCNPARVPAMKASGHALHARVVLAVRESEKRPETVSAVAAAVLRRAGAQSVQEVSVLDANGVPTWIPGLWLMLLPKRKGK